MKFTGEDYLDLNGPLLRGPFSTQDLLPDVPSEDYIGMMQAKYKMFWADESQNSYYAYKQLPHRDDDADPLTRMPYRYGGERYAIGSFVVYDAPPFPVRDTANQVTYVTKSRRASFEMAARLAMNRTPYGGDLPIHLYKETEKEIVEYDENGKPIAYGRMVYISSHDALNMILGERVSRPLRSRLRELFPHASYLAEGAPLVTAHISGAIGVYLNFQDLMAKNDGAQIVLADRGIVISSSAGSRKVEEIVGGWKYQGLYRLLYERGTGLHPSEYDLLLGV